MRGKKVGNMKIAALSDIHYSENTGGILEPIVDKLLEQDISTVVLAGDIADISPDDSMLKECLSLFHGFKHRFYVPGNHELWEDGSKGEINTLRRYENLGNIAGKQGFHCLDFSPVIVENIAFVGNIGWYDYSFHQKEAPVEGLKIIRGGVGDDWSSLSERDFISRKVVVSINGGKPEEFEMFENRYIDIGNNGSSYTDREFSEYLLKSLENQLDIVCEEVGKIVCVGHIAPHIFIPGICNDLFLAMLKPYMGCTALGDLFLKEKYRDKITAVIHGHWHIKGKKTIEGIDFYDAAMLDFSGSFNTPTIIDV